MANTTISVDDRLASYLDEISRPETAVRQSLRKETAKLPMARMQIGANQAAFMEFLVTLIGARRALEVGTFTGLSALAVAGALPKDGRLVCCDINVEWTAIARRAWADAALADKITLKLGPAADTLDALIAEEGTGVFDFAFIDADKGNYDRYYEQCLRLIRPGGLITVDNTLWSGAVVDDADQSVDTNAIRALNRKMSGDPRIDFSLVPVGDGLSLARVR